MVLSGLSLSSYMYLRSDVGSLVNHRVSSVKVSSFVFGSLFL